MHKVYMFQSAAPEGVQAGWIIHILFSSFCSFHCKYLAKWLSQGEVELTTLTQIQLGAQVLNSQLAICNSA